MTSILQKLESKNEYLVMVYGELKRHNDRIVGDALYNFALEEIEDHTQAGWFRRDYVLHGKSLFYDYYIWSETCRWSLYFITQMRQQYEDLMR